MTNLTARKPFTSAASAARKPVPASRTCSENDCITQLSRYNAADRCYVHAPARFPRFRGQFTAEYRERKA
jgi:hypothetical protein